MDRQAEVSRQEARIVKGELSRILLVRLSAMGDLIHVLPAFNFLRRALPGSAIDWLVEDRFAPLIRDYPGLAGTVELPRKAKRDRLRGYHRILRQLRQRKYDAVIDFQGLTKSAMWGVLAGVPIRVGYGDEDGREVSKLFYSRRVVPSDSCLHVVERNLALAKALVDGPYSSEGSFPVDKSASEKIERFWREKGLSESPVVAVNPGAGWETKVWPAERFGELARRFAGKGWKFLVVWGPGEEKTAEDIQGLEPSVIVAPPTDFRELAEIIRRANLFVAGDTGPLHLAAYLNVACIGLYGASDPVRNGPFGTHGKVVTVDCDRVPCWRTRCPIDDAKCLTRISTGQVIEQVEQLLIVSRKDAGKSHAKAQRTQRGD